MAHDHHQKTLHPTHDESGRSKITNRLLEHLHDSEIWASYLPRVPGTLYLLAVGGLALWASSFWALQNGRTALALTGLGLGVLLVLPFIMVGFLVWRRWTFRSNLRRQMLDSISWRGDEKVLDVGCGTGLLLNGVAMRLKSGKAVGIDIWAPHSGGGNIDLLWKNARLEKVADRIEFKEADARQIPFESETFEVVVSSGAVHRLCGEDEVSRCGMRCQRDGPVSKL